MAYKCVVCGKFASSDCVRCTGCKGVYHRACANISNDARVPLKWMCKTCKPQPKANTNLTPQSCPGSTDEEFDEALADAAGSTHIDKTFTQVISNLRSELVAATLEMTCFRQELVKLNSTMADFNNRLTSVEVKVASFDKRICALEAKSDTRDLATEVNNCLNERDQAGYLNDIEISCVEEQSGENPIHIVKLIAQKIGVALEDRDIVSAERSGKHRTPGSPNDKKRPRILTVRLSRRAVRDELMRAARIRRGADTAGIVPDASPQRFYINERLTWKNRQLFLRAREEGRRLGWRYVWTKGGHTYARRDPTSASCRIRSEMDIGKIFIHEA